jgi:Leu/Phe-tRNA-protein transferase
MSSDEENSNLTGSPSSDPEPSIRCLSLDDLLANDVMSRIYADMQRDYYISGNWSPEFYVIQAIRGFISVGYELDDHREVLLPQIQFSYCIFDFANIYMHPRAIKKIKKLHGWRICVNRNFESVISRINEYHAKSWLTSKYKDVISFLNRSGSLVLHLPGILGEYSFRMCSIELYDEADSLVAGELGYAIGATFTSLTGFCKREKHISLGLIQILCMARVLEISGFKFLNLGQPPQNGQMQYKSNLGGTEFSRSDFLERWIPSIAHSPINDHVFFDCNRSISDLFS